jgi:AcrR family transcriptional regulator
LAAKAKSQGAADIAWRDFMTAIVNRWGAPNSARKQDRSKRREQEILRAAQHVFARDGVARSRIGDVAAAAGMPVSTIYEYYSSKEELAYAVPIANVARFFAEYQQAAKDKKTAHARLRLYLWLAADFARRNPEWARLLYLEVWPSVLLSASRVRHCADDYVRVILHLIRQGEANGEWDAGPNPYETAAILVGSVNQVIITALLYGRPKNLTKGAESIIDRVMLLLRHPQPRKAARRRPRRNTAA